MTENKKRDIFYGVVAVATLIVALIGATLAYFSISAGSNENAVNAAAANVSISYNDGQQVMAQADKLIPSSLEVVQKVYTRNKTNFGSEGALAENMCTDDNDRQVCSIYRFSVSSDGTRTLAAYLLNEANGFTTGLSYALYDVNGAYTCDDSEIANYEGTDDNEKRNNCVEAKRWLVLEDNDSSKSQVLKYCSNEDADQANYCSTVAGTEKTYKDIATNSLFGYDTNGAIKTREITANNIQTYDLVIFLKESGLDQNKDQGKEYHGTILVKVTDSGADSGKITGTIN